MKKNQAAKEEESIGRIKESDGFSTKHKAGQHKPISLSGLLSAYYIDQNIIIADKTIHTTEAMVYTMASVYGWNYNDYESHTIYFEIQGNSLYGGIINSQTKEPETKRLIASQDPLSAAKYILSNEQMEKIKNLF